MLAKKNKIWQETALNAHESAYVWKNRDKLIRVDEVVEF